MLRSLLESCLPAPLTPVEVVPLVKQLENEISKSGSPFLRYEDICNIYKVTEKLFTWRMIGDTGTGKSTLISPTSYDPIPANSSSHSVLWAVKLTNAIFRIGTL